MLSWTEKDTFVVDLHWYYLNSFARMKNKKSHYCLILLRELQQKEGSFCLYNEEKTTN